MANIKLENFWQFLSTNDFKEAIPEKFHCLICKNVAIEPFISHCKCRFCSKCITEYLKDEQKHCPGIKDECKEEYLKIEVNISKDIRAIRNIGRISVKCIHEKCEARCDLENMNDHLRVCGMSKAKCPYENIGCQLKQILRDNVKTHYDNEWFSHSQLLVEAIDNLRNDVEVLKKIVERRDEEINKLNEDSTRKEILFTEMNQQINEQKKEIDKQRREIDEDKRNILMLKNKDGRRGSEMELGTTLEIKKQIEIQRKDIDILKDKDGKKELEIETQKKTIMEELKNVKKDIVEIKVRGDIKDLKKVSNEIQLNQRSIKKEICSAIMEMKSSKIHDEREFVWRVDKFSKIKDDHCRDIILWRYSLKLYLSLWCRKNSLGFGCKIMKGEFDDTLEWPMKHKITLSLINQNTLKIHKSREYHYDTFKGDKSVFDKIKDQCSFFLIGEDNFTTIKDLTDSPGLLVNDSLIVSFIIDYN